MTGERNLEGRRQEGNLPGEEGRRGTLWEEDKWVGKGGLVRKTKRGTIGEKKEDIGSESEL